MGIINDIKNKRLQRKLQGKPDKELKSKAIEIAEQDPEKATMVIDQVENPEVKIETLKEVVEHLEAEQVAQVVNNLDPEEATRVLDEQTIIESLKGNPKGEKIIKQVIEGVDGIQPLVDHIDIYNAREIGKNLPNLETEEERIKVASKKIAEVFLSLNGAAMPYVEIEKGLGEEDSILKIADMTVEEIRKEDVERKYEGAPINGLRAKLFSLTSVEEGRNEEVERKKKERIQRWFENGELDEEGTLGELILKGFPYEKDRFDMLITYKDKTKQVEVIKKGISFPEERQVLSVKEKKQIIHSLSEEYKETIIFQKLVVARQQERKQEEPVKKAGISVEK